MRYTIMVFKCGYKKKYIKLLYEFLKHSKRVMIIGNYGSGNLGDEIMLLSLSNLIQTIGIKVIVVPTKNPQLIKKINKQIVKPVTIFSSFIEFFKTDAIIIGGGTLFSSSTGIFIQLCLLICILFKLLRKKLFFIGFGLSNDTPRLIMPFVKLSLKISDGIIFRDQISYNYAREWNLNSYIMPDLAYFITIPERNRLLNSMSINDELINIGISMSSTINDEVYNKIPEAFAQIFDTIIEKLNFNVRLFFLTFFLGFTGKSDARLNMLIINYMKYGSHVKNILSYNPLTMLSFINKLDLIIGIRYHSKIFAQIMNRPLVPIIAHDKDRSFVKENKLPEFELTSLIDDESVRRLFIECILKKLAN